MSSSSEQPNSGEYSVVNKMLKKSRRPIPTPRYRKIPKRSYQVKKIGSELAKQQRQPPNPRPRPRSTTKKTTSSITFNMTAQGKKKKKNPTRKNSKKKSSQKNKTKKKTKK